VCADGKEADMSDHFADVVVHVNETLDETSLCKLEDEINEIIGVMAVTHDAHHVHLLKVDFDAEVVGPERFLCPIRMRGLHAQLVGL
jgi:hypothetical protein